MRKKSACYHCKIGLRHKFFMGCSESLGEFLPARIARCCYKICGVFQAFPTTHCVPFRCLVSCRPPGRNMRTLFNVKKYLASPKPTLTGCQACRILPAHVARQRQQQPTESTSRQRKQRITKWSRCWFQVRYEQNRNPWEWVDPIRVAAAAISTPQRLV